MPKVYFTDDDMCTTQKLQIAQVQDWFVANGWDVIDVPEDADKILCLTCHGWSLLKERSFERIKKINKMNLSGEIVVVGCINDAMPDKVKEIYSGSMISNKHLEEQIESLIPNCKVHYKDIPPRAIFRTKKDYRVYNLAKKFVNIAAGCSFNCSYCTHKPGLGRFKSRKLSDIVDQVQNLVQGKDETNIIVLAGMETAFYGIEYGHTYPQLLRAVMGVDDSFEIHIAQFNPIGISKYSSELIKLFQNKRITDVQIPIQSTSTRILKMMRRPPIDKKIQNFFKKVREKNIAAIFRTDIIVGWPTETMEELDSTLKFAVEYFDEIAVYAVEISPELPAWEFSDLVFPEGELERRVLYAKKYIEKHGKMAHCGQQDDSSMCSVEEKRQQMRMARKTQC